jgi:hypothetical protein
MKAKENGKECATHKSTPGCRVLPERCGCRKIPPQDTSVRCDALPCLGSQHHINSNIKKKRQPTCSFLQAPRNHTTNSTNTALLSLQFLQTLHRGSSGCRSSSAQVMLRQSNKHNAAKQHNRNPHKRNRTSAVTFCCTTPHANCQASVFIGLHQVHFCMYQRKLCNML